MDKQLDSILIEEIPQAIAIYSLDCTLQYVNKEFVKSMGRKREELIGKNPIEAGYLSEKEYHRIKKQVFPILMNKGNVYGFESTAIKKNGSRFNILMNWKLVKNIDKTPNNIVVTVIDITKQKNVEQNFIYKDNELKAHNRIIKKLLQNFSLDERLKLILNEAISLTKVEYGAIFLKKGNKIVLSASKGLSETIYSRINSFPIDKIPNWLIKHQIIHEKIDKPWEIPDFAKLEKIQSRASFPFYLNKNDKKEFIGTLMLASRNYNAFKENDLVTLEALIEELALAIDHVKHHQEAEERLSRLEVLRQIDRLIINRLDIKHILETVLKYVPKSLAAEAIAISLIDNNEHTILFSMRLPNGNVIHKKVFAIDQSLIKLYIKKQEPVIISNISEDPRFQMHNEYIKKYKLNSYLGVPMVAQKKTIGIFHLLTSKPNVFLEEDMDFFRTLAGQAAIAIKSAELLEQTIESEKRYKSIFNNAAEGIYQATLDGKILLSNQQFAYILGYGSTTDFIKNINNINSLYVNHSQRDTFINKIKRKGIVRNCEIQMYHKDGGIIWVSQTAHLINGYNGKKLIYEAICTDITEKKKMELALKESEEKYRNVVEQANEGICIIQDEKLIYLNSKLAEMWGGSPEELIGKTFNDFLNNEELPKFLDLYKKRMQGHHIPRYEANFKRKDGSDLYAEINANLINFMGKPAELVMVNDITEMKKSQKERENLEKQFFQAQKMEAIGRLTGSIAHDFNNMLTAILGYSDFLLFEFEKNNPITEYIQEIKKAALRASDLTGSLLAFSRKQLLKKKVLNINEIIVNMENMLKRLIGEEIELAIDLATDLHMVKADKGQIEQVIMNLVVNARDAMPEGGKIIIKTENIHISEDYCKIYTHASKGDYVCVSFQDNGIGMDEQTIAHIFEPFFTTKSPGKGTGLGLSASFGIIKQHDGWIRVFSKPQKGSTFKIFIPIFSMQQMIYIPKQDDMIQLKELKGKGERILLVEDDKDALKFTKHLLSRNGYEVFTALDISQALKVFEKEAYIFHCLFSDVKLPDGNGIALLEKLIKKNPNLTAIFTSGYLDNESILEQIKEQSYGFLKKPYTVTELLSIIKKYINNLSNQQ